MYIRETAGSMLHAHMTRGSSVMTKRVGGVVVVVGMSARGIRCQATGPWACAYIVGLVLCAACGA